MNAGLHAEAILKAWMAADRSQLETALMDASLPANRDHTDCHLDEERHELLETIVENLSVHTHTGVLPKYSQIRGSLTLLRHLCVPSAENTIQTGSRTFSANILKFPGAKHEMLFRSRMRPRG
jgi:hypothetical protein